MKKPLKSLLKIFLILTFLLSSLPMNLLAKTIVDKKVEVDNINPVTSFEAKKIKKKNVDLVVITDYKGADLSNLKNKIGEFNINTKNDINLKTNYIAETATPRIGIGTQDTFYEQRNYAWPIFADYIKNGTIASFYSDGRDSVITFNNEPVRDIIRLQSKSLKPGEVIPDDRFLPPTSYYKTTRNSNNGYVDEDYEEFTFYRGATEFGPKLRRTTYMYAGAYGNSTIYQLRYSDPVFTYTDRWTYINSTDIPITANVSALNLSQINSFEPQENSDVFVVFALNNNDTNYYSSSIYNQNNTNNYILGTLRDDNLGKLIRDTKAHVYSVSGSVIDNINLSNEDYKVSFSNANNKQNVSIEDLISNAEDGRQLGKGNIDGVIKGINSFALPPKNPNLDIILATDKSSTVTDKIIGDLQNNIPTDISINTLALSTSNSSVIDNYYVPKLNSDKLKVRSLKGEYDNPISYFIIDEYGNLYVKGLNYSNMKHPSYVNISGFLGVPGGVGYVDKLTKVLDNVEDVYITENGYDKRLKTSFAIKKDGTVWLSGANINNVVNAYVGGQYTEYYDTFVKLNYLSNVKKLVTSNDGQTLLIITKDNKLYGIGDNGSKMIKNDSTSKFNSLQFIANDIVNMVSLDNTIILSKSDGSILMSGEENLSVTNIQTSIFEEYKANIRHLHYLYSVDSAIKEFYVNDKGAQILYLTETNNVYNFQGTETNFNPFAMPAYTKYGPDMSVPKMNLTDVKYVVINETGIYILCNNGKLYTLGNYNIVTEFKTLNNIKNLTFSKIRWSDMTTYYETKDNNIYYYTKGSSSSLENYKVNKTNIWDNKVVSQQFINHNIPDPITLTIDGELYSSILNNIRFHESGSWGNVYSYCNKEKVEVKALDTNLITNMNLQENSGRYFIYLSDAVKTDTRLSYGDYFPFGNLNDTVLNYLKDNDFNIYTVTSNEALNTILKPPFITSQKQSKTLRDSINSASKNADSNNFKTSDFIVEKIIEKYKNYNNDNLNSVKYIIVNEDTLDYTSNYSDYENDPQYSSKWLFLHDPTYFENNNGLEEKSRVLLDEPITKFSKTGKYYVTYKAQDNPVGADERFAEYRRWSNAAKTIFYVHNRPIAAFNLKKNNTNIILNENSFDLDHLSKSNKGVVEKVWKWKYTTDSSFTDGMPPSIIPSSAHIIVQLKVKDEEGAWSLPLQISTLKNVNNAPTASFILQKYIMSKGIANTITDNSFDSDGDPITRHWYLLNNSGAVIGDLGTAKPNLSMLGSGKYKIKLVVTDNPTARDPLLMALSSECIRDFEVVAKVSLNNKPKADFEVTPIQLVNKELQYTDKSISGDDWDYLTEWEWSYSKDNGITWTEPTSEPTTIFSEKGNYKIRLRVKDFGNSENPALWSDYCVRGVEILPNNTKPTAAFDLDPKPQLETLPIKVIDKSNPNDIGDYIVEERFSYAKRNSNGSYTSYSIETTERPEVFAESGHYKVRRRVKDKGNILSPGLWSDYYYLEVDILPRNRKPIANFNILTSPTLIGDEIEYIDKSTPGDDWDSLTTWEWSYSIDDGITWTEPINSPPKKFNSKENVLVRLRVKDKGNILSPALWSDYCIRNLSIMAKTNNPPVARFTVSPNPQIENGNLTYNETSYDPDSWDKITEKKWSWYKLGDSNWSAETNTPPTKFTSYGTYFIALRVKDGGNEEYPPMWSDYCIQQVNILPINHKPIANFTFTPNPQIIDKYVTFTDTSTPGDDWDSLTAWEWSYRKKGGGSFINWSSSNTPTPLNFATEGTYEIRLRVKDAGNILSLGLWSDYTIKEITIINVTVEGQVNHTTEWNNNRVKYNRSKTNANDSPRTYDVFFPGERFMLKALTTEGATCTRVIVHIQEYPEFNTELTNTSSNIWEGSIWDVAMVDWDNQNLNFKFTAIYSNGIIKTDIVTVNIVEDEYWRIHRHF